jgi:hypothetical protein
MKVYTLLLLTLSTSILAADADKQKLFAVPNMPPLGANKWSAAPMVIPLILANEAELPKGVPPAEPVTLNGELPLLDPKGKPIAVRREKDAKGEESGLGIDTGGQGTFFIKVPNDKQGHVVFFDVPRGIEPNTNRPRTERYALRFASVDGNWQYQRSGGLRGTALGTNFLLIDSNANGRFDDMGMDWIIVGANPPVQLSASMQIGNTRYAVKLDAGGGGPLTLTPELYSETLSRGIGHLNAWRERIGCPPIKLHDELTRWAQCHADFLVKNSVMGLGEDPAMPGYTKEGAWAGGHACCTAGPQDIGEGVDEITNSVLHRILLASPYLTVTGIGYAPPDPQLANSVSETVVDVGSTGDGGIEWLLPIACPADGQTGIKPVWLGGAEVLPFDPPAEGVGYPITLTFPSTKAAKTLSLRSEGAPDSDMPKDVVCELREEGGAAALECWISDPLHPAQPKTFADNLASISIVPKKPLNADTVYTVTVQCTIRSKPFEKKWKFATGSAVMPPNYKLDQRPVWKRNAPPPLPNR